jgi:hypothetical protein
MPKLQNILNGQWFIVSEDGRTELTGPMTEKDARAFLGLLDAIRDIAVTALPNHPSGTSPLSDEERRRILGIARTAHQAVMEK